MSVSFLILKTILDGVLVTISLIHEDRSIQFNSMLGALNDAMLLHYIFRILIPLSESFERKFVAVYFLQLIDFVSFSCFIIYFYSDCSAALTVFTCLTKFHKLLV